MRLYGINSVNLTFCVVTRTHPSDPHTFHYNCYSVATVEAEIDVLTGQYQLRQMDMLYDCGDRSVCCYCLSLSSLIRCVYFISLLLPFPHYLPQSLKLELHRSRTARMARRNTCFLSLPMDATVQHCPATVPAVTGIDRPKLGQRRSSGHTVHTTDEARTALRLSKLRSIKILYTLTMIYDFFIHLKSLAWVGN